MNDRATALRTLRVITEECQRAKQTMRLPGHPRPYYVSYLVRDEEDWRVKARYGSISVDRYDRGRNGFVDVRVGSYRNDQLQDGGLLDNDKDAESYTYVDLPYGPGPDGLRHGLWRLADARFREAVEGLLDKQSRHLTYQDTNRQLRALQKMRPETDIAWRDTPKSDPDAWREFVESASRSLRSLDHVKDGFVEIERSRSCVYFASSEGVKKLRVTDIWSVECYLWLLSPRGDSFPHTIKKTVTDPSELPTLSEFRAEIRRAARQLEGQFDAPLVRSFCGPALLEPVPAGLLIHEAVGHRLEGSRLLSTGEGQTFKDSVGKQILPEFLSLYDDPTLDRFEGKSLVGHYPFDDEGVAAGSASLVERGRLKGFLTGREPIGKRHASNGHSRGSYHRRPVSRMGNLIAESHAGLEPAELEAKFLQEIRDSGAPFGIRIVEASSGETTTDAYNFQAFLGEAGRVERIYPDGRREWVRGLSFVGTPLNAIRSIVAAGNRYAVDNAWCGAESGYVPVSTVSPALLLSELEMQGKPDEPYSQYTFPIPWES